MNLIQGHLELRLKGLTTFWLKLLDAAIPVPGDDIIGFITKGRGITSPQKRLHKYT